MSNQTAELSFVHMVQVKYVGPTNTRGARVKKYVGPTNTRGASVKLTSLRFDNNSVTLSRDDGRSVLDQGVAYLHDNGYNPVSVSDWKDGWMIACNVFKPLQ